MEFLYDWGLFVTKFASVAVILVIAIIFILMSLRGARELINVKDEKFKFTDLMREARQRSEEIKDAIAQFDVSRDKKAQLKEKKKKLKMADKLVLEENSKRLEEIKKAEEEGRFCPDKLFVIEFDGDTKASEQQDLIKKINVILDVAGDKDEVIINMTSPGGVVNGYGLCASVLERIRHKGVRLTVCVDNVAASGGYLMSCVANHIVAAPFSYIGSIGVVANIPNFNRVLNRFEVDYDQVTAGKYKRTMTMLGRNTLEGREKFRQELEQIHTRFKELVFKYRPKLDMEKVATGEFWLATDAIELGLVDEINTFDAYLQNTLAFTKTCAIKISIERKEKSSIREMLSKFLSVKSWVGAIKKEVSPDSYSDLVKFR